MSAPGRKDDAGKLRWHLFPWRAARRVMEVIEFGARTYGEENWKGLAEPWSRYGSALQRHMVAWFEGEVTDAKSQLPTLAHVACNALFLLWLEGRLEKSDSAGVPVEAPDARHVEPPRGSGLASERFYRAIIAGARNDINELTHERDQLRVELKAAVQDREDAHRRGEQMCATAIRERDEWRSRAEAPRTRRGDE